MIKHVFFTTKYISLIVTKVSDTYLLYILIRPFKWTSSPFLSQLMRGGGIPSAWHIKRAVPALGRVWLSGLTTMDGGTETEMEKKSVEINKLSLYIILHLQSSCCRVSRIIKQTLFQTIIRSHMKWCILCHTNPIKEQVDDNVFAGVQEPCRTCGLHYNLPRTVRLAAAIV